MTSEVWAAVLLALLSLGGTIVTNLVAIRSKQIEARNKKSENKLVSANAAESLSNASAKIATMHEELSADYKRQLDEIRTELDELKVELHEEREARLAAIGVVDEQKKVIETLTADVLSWRTKHDDLKKKHDKLEREVRVLKADLKKD